MVYTPCFEKVYFYIRNQSACFRETSFLKVGPYNSFHQVTKLPLPDKYSTVWDTGVENIFLFLGPQSEIEKFPVRQTRNKGNC